MTHESTAWEYICQVIFNCTVFTLTFNCEYRHTITLCVTEESLLCQVVEPLCNNWSLVCCHTGTALPPTVGNCSAAKYSLVHEIMYNFILIDDCILSSQ